MNYFRYYIYTTNCYSTKLRQADNISFIFKIDLAEEIGNNYLFIVRKASVYNNTCNALEFSTAFATTQTSLVSCFSLLNVTIVDRLTTKREKKEHNKFYRNHCDVVTQFC